MRKTITLALVLVLALGAAVPALAYTTNTSVTGSNLYSLDIYLVEYSGSGSDALSLFLSQAPADRGYAKNEIVAAIGSVTVPANADVYGDGYDLLKFTGKNVSLNVTENNRARLLNTMPNAANWQRGDWGINSDGTQITHPIGSAVAPGTNSFPVTNATTTYRFLVFGKVLDDDATLSIALGRGGSFTVGTFFVATLTNADGTQTRVRADEYLTIGGRYLVTKPTGMNEYWISRLPSGYTPGTNMRNYPDNLMFRIGYGANNKTSYLYMYPAGENGPEYRVYPDSYRQNVTFMLTRGNPGWNITAGQLYGVGSTQYNILYPFYEEHFENALGLTALNEGNIMRDADWGNLIGAGDIVETVNIQPWTPYVTVPDIVISDPPKTGDLSILGFVLMSLAGAAAVVVRKVRA